MIPHLFIKNLNRLIKRQLFSVGCLGLLLCFPSFTFALEIEEVIWGFNNQSTQGKCIPLSLLLSNNTPEVFDELMQLNRQQYNGSKVGAPLFRAVYLAPFSSKWVQFYPYIIDQGQNNWSLNWGPRFIYSRKISSRSNASTMDENGGRDSSRIILTGMDALSRSGRHFKQFPEELFPPFVTAADSLDEVILDHVPKRWEAARRGAFMDWLYQGGVLHLLPDSSGDNLVFSDTMNELNAPFEHFRIGSGLVIRHQGDLKQIDKEKIKLEIEKVRATQLSSIDIPESLQKRKKKPNTNNQTNDDYRYGDTNAGFLQKLSDITRPEHNWELIYVMTILYIFMIYPGCYLYNKRQKGYRSSLLFLLISVALFSTIFWTIGKRGYGETTTMNSLIIAQPLQDGQYDLTGWVNSFVTDGAEYQFSLTGDGPIYSTAQETEKIKGGIINGVEGKFIADIPPFSDRRFMYRIKSKYKLQDFELIDQKIGTNSILEIIKIRVNSALPENTKRIQALYGRALYDLKQSQEAGSLFLVLGNQRTPLSAWNSKLDSDELYGRQFGYGEEEQDPSKIYDSLYERLVLKNLNIEKPSQLNQYQGDLSHLQLFIYCDLPDEFKLKTNVQGSQQGRVLFTNQLALLEKKDNSKND
ncbi:hypothetical protein V202x_45030 [Gimesia aquarii]|uniref:Uncharacterized protein n=1 Tax=Gimesia aquarii TaxID=2527964 RepID=A0A517X0Q0_9PLAN|nr:hypothetical protein V202x_45030 [Gimesia aquarii]